MTSLKPHLMYQTFMKKFRSCECSSCKKELTINDVIFHSIQDGVELSEKYETQYFLWFTHKECHSTMMQKIDKDK